MLIEKLIITDHPAIGTVELDFRDEIGAPARVIVLAGQNGVGKTVVLEAIQSLFEQICNFPGQIDADIILDEIEEARAAELLAPYVNGERLHLRNRLHVVRRQNVSFSISHERIAQGNIFGVENGPTGLAFRAFFSPANVMFSEGSPTVVSAEVVDRPNLLSSRIGADGVAIAQLLVALEAQDGSCPRRWCS